MDYEEASNLLIMCSSFDRFKTFLKIKDELNDKDYWRTLTHAYTGSDNLNHLKEEVKESFLLKRNHKVFRRFTIPLNSLEYLGNTIN